MNNNFQIKDYYYQLPVRTTKCLHKVFSPIFSPTVFFMLLEQ